VAGQTRSRVSPEINDVIVVYHVGMPYAKCIRNKDLYTISISIGLCDKDKNFVFAHEHLHIKLGHMNDPCFDVNENIKKQIARDFVINQMLIDMGIKPSPKLKILLPVDFGLPENMSEEWYVEHISDDVIKRVKTNDIFEDNKFCVVNKLPKRVVSEGSSVIQQYLDDDKNSLVIIDISKKSTQDSISYWSSAVYYTHGKADILLYNDRHHITANRGTIFDVGIIKKSGRFVKKYLKQYINKYDLSINTSMKALQLDGCIDLSDVTTGS